MPRTGAFKNHRAQPGSCAGFTYIGVLVLVALMGIALGVVADVWQTAQRRDKEEELLFVGNQFRRALTMYAANGAGNPHSLEDLLKDPGFPGVRRYLRKIYRDPITGRAEWGLVKPDGNAIIGVHSLSDAEPIKQSGFSLADQDFSDKKKYSEWVFSALLGQASFDTNARAGSARPGAAPADSAQSTPAPPAAAATVAPQSGSAQSAAIPSDIAQPNVAQDDSTPYQRSTPGFRGRR